MPRPSRHLDRALLAAGRELLPVHGCSGLTVRQVCEAAGVNIGMFHYHFRTREAYLRAVMQAAYEEMFSNLALGAAQELNAMANLRNALQLLGRFLLENRALMARVFADALNANLIAREFLAENFPRHLHLILGLLAAGRAEKDLKPLPPFQSLAFCAGALGLPILVGEILSESAALDRSLKEKLHEAVLTEEALDERIDLVMSALANPAKRRRRR